MLALVVLRLCVAVLTCCLFAFMGLIYCFDLFVLACTMLMWLLLVTLGFIYCWCFSFSWFWDIEVYCILLSFTVGLDDAICCSLFCCYFCWCWCTFIYSLFSLVLTVWDCCALCLIWWFCLVVKWCWISCWADWSTCAAFIYTLYWTLLLIYWLCLFCRLLLLAFELWLMFNSIASTVFYYVCYY